MRSLGACRRITSANCLINLRIYIDFCKKSISFKVFRLTICSIYPNILVKTRDQMFNLDSIKEVQILIALLIAYVPIVTITGFIEAWAITLAGDDSAEDAGFLTLNPLRHIDPVGMFVLFLIKWGFGQRVPFNPANITSPLRSLKFAAVLFTKPMVHLILTVISFLASTLFKTPALAYA